MTSPVRRLLPAVLATSLFFSGPAFAQDTPSGETIVTPDDAENLPPPLTPSGKVKLDFFDTSLWDMVRFFARLKRMNFVIGDPKDLQSKKVTIISNYEVSPDEAYQAFLSALEVSGYTISTVGDTSKIVKSSEAGQKPIRIGTGQPARSDDFVTQLIQLENVQVDDMTKIIQSMAPSEAKIIAYPPTNTLIITDTANNIRKLYKLMKELDVAAPKSSMVIYQLRYADSVEVQGIIEQLYGTAETTDDSSSRSSRTSSRSSRRSSRSSRSSRSTPTETEAVSAGESAKYIQKVLNDERTNSLIVLANEDGHQAVLELLKKIDVDVDPQNRAQIHVVYLENAKADEVATVLSQLSQGGASASSSRNSRNSRNSTSATTPASRVAAAAGRTTVGEDAGGEASAIAAFDSGMRIAADENTNSLVIIANMEDFRVVETVIEKLDIKRKQVFVDAVVLELTSEDSNNFNIAAHVPQAPGENAVGFLGAQLGTQSLGLSQDALTGLAFGVYGETVEVPITDPTTGLPSTLAIPAFGIALNAIKTAGSTNIISNPNLTTLDNQEAQIVVGRKIPFPTNSTFNNVGQPIISFQREDVAITLKITPRINSENYVTLELEIEVQEVEDSAEGAAVQAAGGGFITSKRELKTVALVRDNQTMVIGGLVGNTESQTENKVPVLGDIPLVGALFRSSSRTDRKTNLMVFLTPHIIDDPDDMYEIQRVKEAQRQEFLRRFYGKSRDAYWEELRSLLRYSMNLVEEPSMYRGPTSVEQDLRLDGAPLSDETAAAVEVLGEERTDDPGASAGTVDESTPVIVIDDLPDAPEGPTDGEGTVQPEASPASEGGE